MATYTKNLLSGSTSGKPIPVAATATPGTTIHTAISSSDALDEIWLWATNVTGSAATLTLEWGGTTDPGNHAMKAISIPPYTRLQIIDGQLLNGGLVVKAFSGTASAINLTGYVHRII